MRAGQLRPRFASMAYVLLCALRRIGLHHIDLAEATCGTIHLKLLKIGALVRGSVRRIKAAMPCRKARYCLAVNIYAPSSMKGNVTGFSINGHLRSVYRPVMSECGDDHVELRGIITQFQRFSSS
jgi:Transposase DDE domain group 1